MERPTAEDRPKVMGTRHEEENADKEPMQKFGIHTAMHAQVIAPNRLKLIDDPDPPDDDDLLLSDPEGEDAMEGDYESVDEDIMVEKTPAT